jgi:hypothetical protein
MPRQATQRGSTSYVADFIRTLLASLNVVEHPDMSKAAWWISWPKKGTLLFSAEDLAHYPTSGYRWRWPASRRLCRRSPQST